MLEFLTEILVCFIKVRNNKQTDFFGTVTYVEDVLSIDKICIMFL